MVFFIWMSTTGQTFYQWRKRTHATDCTSLTDGRPADLCFEEDSDTLYTCETTDNLCDTAGEWSRIASALPDNIHVSGDIQADGDIYGTSGIFTLKVEVDGDVYGNKGIFSEGFMIGDAPLQTPDALIHVREATGDGDSVTVLKAERVANEGTDTYQFQIYHDRKGIITFPQQGTTWYLGGETNFAPVGGNINFLENGFGAVTFFATRS